MLDMQHARGDDMDLNDCMQQMSHHAELIRHIVADLSDVDARWKPEPDAWSVLEVVTHLHDEEREDFRVRLDIILHRPDEPWPKIDPQGWVTSRHYNERELEESLSGFLEERENSLQWLRGLDSPDWEAVYQAPWGPIRAGDMLSAWVAHDLLHLRQLVELRWAHTTRRLAPYQTRYAGEW
jgi:hypothetical protein